jgi:hypothetical protein
VDSFVVETAGGPTTRTGCRQTPRRSHAQLGGEPA